MEKGGHFAALEQLLEYIWRGRSVRFSVSCVRELLGLKVLKKFKGTLHGGNETTLFLMSRTTCTSAWSL